MLYKKIENIYLNTFFLKLEKLTISLAVFQTQTPFQVVAHKNKERKREMTISWKDR